MLKTYYILQRKKGNGWIDCIGRYQTLESAVKILDEANQRAKQFTWVVEPEVLNKNNYRVVKVEAKYSVVEINNNK
jgi:hypothetical protein